MRCGPGTVILKLNFPLAVGFGGAAYVHAVGEVDEEDFVACGGLVGGAVGDGAGEGGILREARGQGQREDGG